MDDEVENVVGSEWFNSSIEGAAEQRTNCPRCESIMCEDKAMCAAFELIRKNLGEKLNIKTFEVGCWVCPDCGYRQGFYQRYEGLR